jgi:hypothetical protein
VVETSVVSSAITLKHLAELHSETITCCNCLPQIAISSFYMVGDRYLAFGGLLQMSSQNLISLGPVVDKSYAIAFLFGVTA